MIQLGDNVSTSKSAYVDTKMKIPNIALTIHHKQSILLLNMCSELEQFAKIVVKIYIFTKKKLIKQTIKKKVV